MITCKTLGREQRKKSLVLKDKMQLLSIIRLNLAFPAPPDHHDAP